MHPAYFDMCVVELLCTLLYSTVFMFSHSVMSNSLPPLGTVARQAPLSIEILQARILDWLPLPTLGDLPDPGIEPASLTSPALAGGFFTTRATSKALRQEAKDIDYFKLMKLLSLRWLAFLWSAALIFTIVVVYLSWEELN